MGIRREFILKRSNIQGRDSLWIRIIDWIKYLSEKYEVEKENDHLENMAERYVGSKNYGKF